MRNRRILRMMAGDIKSPAQRCAERLGRRDARTAREFDQAMALAAKIARRENNDPDLPPMPLNFAEIERRRREGKQ